MSDLLLPPQMAAVPQNLSLVPASEVRALLIKASSEMASCQGRLLAILAEIEQTRSYTEIGQQALTKVSLLGQGIDRSMFAGPAEAESLGSAAGRLIIIARQLGEAAQKGF